VVCACNSSASLSCLSFRIAFRKIHQHTDPPHPFALLRARRERPSGYRTADERDEVTPFHLPDASRASHRKDSTPRYRRRPLHCGILIRPMSALGQKRREPSARVRSPRPLYPKSRQTADRLGMSALCQKRSFLQMRSAVHNCTLSSTGSIHLASLRVERQSWPGRRVQ